MQALRHASFLARLVLAWFALAVGVAMAAPLVAPQGIELVCSAGGAMKVVLKGHEGAKPDSAAALDCPLCAGLDAVPTLAPCVAEFAQPLGYVLRSIPAAHIAALTAAPLPARGPPVPVPAF